MLTLAGVNDENLIELSKQTGAKIALRGGNGYIAWTDVTDGVPHLRGVVVGP